MFGGCSITARGRYDVECLAVGVVLAPGNANGVLRYRYVVTNMYVRVKADYPKNQHSLVTGRMSTVAQIGSFLGTIIPFLILSVFHLVPSNPASACGS